VIDGDRGFRYARRDVDGPDVDAVLPRLKGDVDTGRGYGVADAGGSW
jgi:hypothetical protein